jgi:hypothetical protein
MMYLSVLAQPQYMPFSGSISIIVDEAGVNPRVKSLSYSITVKKWFIAGELTIDFS